MTGGFGALTRADLFDPTTNTWAPAAELPARYAGHRAERLADGRVFIYGGAYLAMGAQSHAAVWDPGTDTWIGGRIQEYVDGRKGHTASRLPDGRVLLAGGDRRARGKVYDPRASSPNVSYAVYLQQSNFRQCHQRYRHTATALPDGSVLIAGGSQSSRILSETERFVPGVDHFERAAAMAFERTAHTASALPDGRVVVVGGYGRLSVDAPDDGRCAAPSPAPAPAPAPIVVAAPRLVQVPKARRPPARPLATVELYDPLTDSWTPGPPLWSVRAGHTASVLDDGRVLIAGGQGPSGPSATLWLLDSDAARWKRLPDMAFFRTSHTATALHDGRVLIVGGTAHRARIVAAELWPGT